MLTVKQAAELLSISTDYCYDLVNAGAIPAYRLGKGKRAPIRLEQSDVEAYRDSCRITGPLDTPTTARQSPRQPLTGYSFLRKHGLKARLN